MLVWDVNLILCTVLVAGLLTEGSLLLQLLVLLPVLEKNSTYFVQTQSLFQYKWLDSYLDKLGTHTPFEATPQADMVAVSDQKCVFRREFTRWASGAGFLTRCVCSQRVYQAGERCWVCDQMCVFPESVPGGREVLGL